MVEINASMYHCFIIHQRVLALRVWNKTTSVSFSTSDVDV